MRLGGASSFGLRRHVFIAVGAILFLTGFFGLSHAIAASRAFATYVRVKYGMFPGTVLEVQPPETASEIIDAAFDAGELYPDNYYFYALASRCALEEVRASWPSDPVAWTNNLDLALRTGEEAVRLNPYDAESRQAYVAALLRAGTSWRGSNRVEEAEAFCRGVVETEFWNPDSHALLADVLLRKGDLRGAGEQYLFVRSTYPNRNRLLRQARRFGLPTSFSKK